ncbi:MAG: Omp85 family outer membrane protein [Bacteroidota bacterium]
MHFSTATQCARLVRFALVVLIFPSAAGAVTTKADTLLGITRLSERELLNKGEGGSIAALPGPAFSPDLGLVVGIVGGYYFNGRRTDPLFAYEPYQYAVTGVVSASTRGLFALTTRYDAPHYRQSLYRVRAEVRFERNPAATYYGTGEASLEPLTAPDGRRFTRFVDYQEALLAIQDGHTYAYFDNYLNRMVSGRVELGRNLGRSPLRVFAGLVAGRSWIDDYTADDVPAKLTPDAKERTDATMLETRLALDSRAGRIVGTNGGWNNGIVLGLAYDSRDLEPHPRRGVFHDATLSAYSGLLGSDFDYAVATLTARIYHKPFPAFDAVLAARVLYSSRFGTVPFFMTTAIPTADRSFTGLGGDASMRGYREGRFSAREMMLMNLEFRWVFFERRVGGQFVEVMMVPFLDAGGVFDSLSRTSFDDLRHSYGAGLRFGYNQAFVVSMDFGWSREDPGMFYLAVGHIF